MKYFLSLGSNLGKKKKNLVHALVLLEKEGIRILRASSYYRTQPVDYFPQPWFCNQVVEVDADIPPIILLNLIKKIEMKMKRVPSVEKGPRKIDIDILLAGKNIIRTKKLVVPHPGIEKRNFVLVPFKEIAPDIIHPLLKERIEDLWRKSRDHTLVKKVRERSKPTKKVMPCAG